MQSFPFSAPARPTLQVALFAPERPARAAVLIIPGFSEHIGRYRHVAEAWAEAGFLVAVYDARGHGDSAGRRAHIHRFSDYTSDALSLLDFLDTKPEWSTLGNPILFGHSLGAVVTTLVALEHPSRFLGLALSSPYFGRALRVPRWKRLLGSWVSGFWPTYSDMTGITGLMVTHDPERARAMDADPKRLPRVTARWFTETAAAQLLVQRLAPRLELPLFCLAAEEDLVAEVETTRSLFGRFGSQQKELRVLSGQRHDLHQEIERNAHIRAFAEQFRTWADRSGASSEPRR